MSVSPDGNPNQDVLLTFNDHIKKFNLGCGDTFLPGFMNIGFWNHLEQERIYVVEGRHEKTLLLNHDLRLGLPTPNNALDVVYHAHFLEHLPYKDGLSILRQCYNALVPGGIHRMVVPDLEAFARAYLTDDDTLLRKYGAEIFPNDQDIYKTKGSIFVAMLHSHEHKWGYDFETLKWALEDIGFRNIRKMAYRQSELPNIDALENYEELRIMESLFVECVK